MLYKFIQLFCSSGNRFKAPVDGCFYISLKTNYLWQIHGKKPVNFRGFSDLLFQKRSKSRNQWVDYKSVILEIWLFSGKLKASQILSRVCWWAPINLEDHSVFIKNAD